jgi:hypothetical protein
MALKQRAEVRKEARLRDADAHKTETDDLEKPAAC